MKKRMTREEKAALRGVARSHFDHVVALLRDRPPYFLDKAKRSLEDGHRAYLEARQYLPNRSVEALFNRHYEVKKKLEAVAREWEQFHPTRGKVTP